MKLSDYCDIDKNDTSWNTFGSGGSGLLVKKV